MRARSCAGTRRASPPLLTVNEFEDRLLPILVVLAEGELRMDGVVSETQRREPPSAAHSGCRRTRSSRCAPALSPAAVDAAAAVAVAAAAAASAAAAADVAAVAAGAVAGTGAGEREVRGISFDGFAVSRMLLLLSAKAKVCC